MSDQLQHNALVPSREQAHTNISVFIIDDQNLSCKLLQTVLEPEPDLKIVGTTADSQTALAQIEKLQPDIALVAREMPGIDGFALTQMICERFPDTKVLILTSYHRPKYINQALMAGAKGYLLKDAPAKELANAIRFVNQEYLQFGSGLFKTIDAEVSAILPADQESEPEKGDWAKPTLRDRHQTTAQSATTDIVLSSTQLPAKVAAEDDWSPATEELLDVLPRVWTRGLLYLIIIFTAIALPWSILAHVDETGTARGRLEPKNKTIQLDAPVAGTVAAINIEEGDTVEKEQILVELEPDVIRAERQQLEEKQTGQLNRLTQLELLQNQLSLALHTQQQQNQAQQLEKQAQVEQARQNLDGLQGVYQTQKEEKLAQLEQAKQAIEASNAAHRLAAIALAGARDKASRYRQAFRDGVIPEDRLKDIEQQAKENQESLVQAGSEVEQARSRLKEVQSNSNKLIQQTESEIEQAQLHLQEQERSYQSLVYSGKLALLKTEEQLKDLETQITTLKADIAQTNKQIESLEFQLQQRVLKSPASGTVFHISTPGAGAVVQPGEKIVEIAPEKSPLVVRAKIAPTESGFLQVGMPVKLKFDAYPFQDYGVISGRVSWISPDSKISETDESKGETFELEIELDQTYIEGQNRRIALTPGQTATAEIIIRQRRLIDFVLDPFKKLQKGGLEL